MSSLAATYHAVVAGRLAVILSSIGFWALWTRDSITARTDTAIFSILILLSCVEKIASMANLVSVERDWVSLTNTSRNASLTPLRIGGCHSRWKRTGTAK